MVEPRGHVRRHRDVDLEHARHQFGPGQAMAARLLGRDDLIADSGAGSEDPVVPYQVEAWRRHQGGELLVASLVARRCSSGQLTFWNG